MKINEFQQKIEYDFKSPDLLERALTHSSFNRDQNTRHKDNERLEFIGDAFLDAIIGEELYVKMPKASEGSLTKIRALIVCERALADVARKLELGCYLNLGHGEESQGGRNKDSILADAMEAVIGAVYMDGGFEEMKKLVLRSFKQTVEDAMAGQLFADYKSQLQEHLQKKGTVINISYVTDKEEGPPHDRTFYVHMECNGEAFASGVGKSKKEAEQDAAKNTLAALNQRTGEQ